MLIAGGGGVSTYVDAKNGKKSVSPISHDQDSLISEFVL